jgi:integrase
VATCKRSRSCLDARDEAILRLFIDSGMRLSELATLTPASVDFANRVVHVIGKRTKGHDRPRVTPFGAKTAAALDRYLNRFRPGHYLAASTDALWLGRAGALTPNGIAQLVAERGIAAKVPFRVHPHMFRHAWVAQSLHLGMQEGDVMRITGHTSRSLLDRYGAYTAVERALDVYRRIPRPEV